MDKNPCKVEVSQKTETFFVVIPKLARPKDSFWGSQQFGYRFGKQGQVLYCRVFVEIDSDQYDFAHRAYQSENILTMEMATSLLKCHK